MVEQAPDFTLRWVSSFYERCISVNFPNLVDFYEVALVLGACFLVNYVTADAKTNWVEGFIMVSFYFMIVSIGASIRTFPSAYRSLRLYAVGSIPVKSLLCRCWTAVASRTPFQLQVRKVEVLSLALSRVLVRSSLGSSDTRYALFSTESLFLLFHVASCIPVSYNRLLHAYTISLISYPIAYGFL